MTETTAKYRTEVQQMMFVAGETADVSVETTTQVENIVRQQVHELLSRANALALRRGSRAVAADDLIFLIRSDREKVARLLTFLSWKELRKNAKADREGGGGGDKPGADLDLPDTLPDDSGLAGGGPSADAAQQQQQKPGKRRRLPWDVSTLYAEAPPERDDDDERDEELQELHSSQLARLRAADERTRNMTREEYAFWSECRQATFTRRKAARFREWAGFGVVTEGGPGGKPSEDVVDILGFLTFQMVVRLTEEAVKVKGAERVAGVGRGSGGGGGGGFVSGSAEDGAGGKRKRGEGVEQEDGPFGAAGEVAAPVEPRHVGEAFRRLQRPSARRSGFMGLGARMRVEAPLRLF